MNVGTVAELWRYPVKSMGGEQVASSVVDGRALHGDRLWAVRDLGLDAVTTARRLPALLGCTARYVDEPPAGVGPGDVGGVGGVADVLVTLPDDTQVATTDRAELDARLSALVGTPVALVPLPALDDRAAYRGVGATRQDLRRQFGLAEDEPLPDLSVFPLRKLAELARYATPVGMFADAYPLHVLTTSSLRAMAAHGGDFDVRRFRPNVVVDGALDGLAEQEWVGGTLRAGGVSAHVEIPTIRCTVPLRAQAGLPADADVVRTVSRHGERYLGVYADITTPGLVQVGDPVELDPPRGKGPAATSVARLVERARRNAVRTGHRALPR